MASWRMDMSNEREVQQSAKRPQTFVRKAATDDDEFDFSAPQAKAKAPERPAAPISSSEPPVQPADLLNPLKFSLHRLTLKRAVGEAFGFSLASSSHGVLKVAEIADGGLADKTGFQKDMYLMAMEGRRMNTDADVRAIEKDRKRRSVHVTLVKKRPIVWQQGQFPLPPSVQRKHGSEYLLLRLDPTNGTAVGTGIGERDNLVYITKVMENSAGLKADVRAGDRVVAVDEVAVDNREHCKTLVKKSFGNPFDMAVERAPPPPPAPAPAPPPVRKAAPPPPVDPYAGDPTHGVPQTPTDVSVFLDIGAKKKVAESVRVATKKKKKAKKESERSSMGRSQKVKMIKKAESIKLKKP